MKRKHSTYYFFSKNFKFKFVNQEQEQKNLNHHDIIIDIW